MGDLAQRLEQASEGRRVLSDDVLLALGWEKFLGYDDLWKSPAKKGFSRRPRPHPAASVDDGLALLREMGDWWLYGMGEERTSIVYAGDEHYGTGKFYAQIQHAKGGRLITKQAATPALALSAALVRAAQAKKEAASEPAA